MASELVRKTWLGSCLVSPRIRWPRASMADSKKALSTEIRQDSSRMRLLYGSDGGSRACWRAVFPTEGASALASFSRASATWKIGDACRLAYPLVVQTEDEIAKADLCFCTAPSAIAEEVCNTYDQNRSQVAANR